MNYHILEFRGARCKSHQCTDAMRLVYNYLEINVDREFLGLSPGAPLCLEVKEMDTKKHKSFSKNIDK